MLKGLTKAAMVAALLAGGATAALAQDFTIRATANSNENDEDYDGLVVFKNFVEQASNGAITVELFIGTQLCSNGAECLQGVADGSIDVYFGPKPPPGKESNWIQTIPGKSWFIALRIYGPEQPWIDGKWRPSTVELVK